MALCLLVDDWVRGRGGRLTALIVDHGLRPESHAEARQVASWLAARNIPATILSWGGAKPDANIQANARRARYGLLTAWCRAAGVLHLFLAHHLDDQAETFLLRLGRGSGGAGLAAMAALAETPDVRFLRPLLATPREELRKFLETNGQPWIEDPANHDPSFARARVRAMRQTLEEGGIRADRTAAAATAMGDSRAVLDGIIGEFLAVSTTIHPAGYCLLDPTPWAGRDDEVGARALGRVLCSVGGAVFPPRRKRLMRLLDPVTSGCPFPGRTLAGCRVVMLKGKFLVCREAAAANQAVVLTIGRSALWDGRFVVTLGRRSRGSRRRYSIRRLGTDGWAEIVVHRPELRDVAIPFPARASLPALWDLDGVAEVPHLGFVRSGRDPGHQTGFSADFRPSQPLGAAPFVPAKGNPHANLRTLA